MEIYAWVILDNHFHAIVAAPALSRAMASLKRHTAQCLLTQAGTEGREWLVNQFEFYRAKHKTESQCQVWQEGYHPQELSTDEAIIQKIDYIHDNPVQRGMVSLPEHWVFVRSRVAGGRQAGSAVQRLAVVGEVEPCSTRLTEAKYNFADKCVPKCNLGTREANDRL
jgi:REP element-mobilizing transposase RayT